MVITLNQIEPLDHKKHDRTTFTCGVTALDTFFREKARKESPELSATFVLTCIEEPTLVLGYYSLSSATLRADDLPATLSKKLGHYGHVPATLLGRLAVHEQYQRLPDLRLGELLLINAMSKCYSASKNVASFGMIVRVLKGEKGDPTAFYEKYGFIRCEETADLMFLPLKTIEQSLRTAGLV